VDPACQNRIDTKLNKWTCISIVMDLNLGAFKWLNDYNNLLIIKFEYKPLIVGEKITDFQRNSNMCNDLEWRGNRVNELKVRCKLRNGGTNTSERGTHSNMKLHTFSF
jgi:hypothetical protein